MEMRLSLERVGMGVCFWGLEMSTRLIFFTAAARNVQLRHVSCVDKLKNAKLGKSKDVLRCSLQIMRS